MLKTLAASASLKLHAAELTIETSGMKKILSSLDIAFALRFDISMAIISDLSHYLQNKTHLFCQRVIASGFLQGQLLASIINNH